MVKFVHLLDYDIIQRGDAIRRIYDLPLTAQPDVSFRRISLKTFPTDSEKEGHTYSSKSFRLLDGLKRFFLVIMNLRVLRDADLILCSEGDYYWVLIFLGKIRIFTSKPIIWRFFFKTGSARRVLPRITSEENFQIGVVSKAQKRAFASSHVRYIPWRIDVEWFTPKTPNRDGKRHYFIPGNAQRDEEFVKRLAQVSFPSQLVRCGRSSQLKRIYHHEVETHSMLLSINPSHSEYLDFLRKSLCVMLPISDCDEPAGLTALLEALACGIPVVATDSLGISELATELPGMICLLKSDDPHAWFKAASALSVVSVSERQMAVDYVRKNHALGNESVEFRELFMS